MRFSVSVCVCGGGSVIRFFFFILFPIKDGFSCYLTNLKFDWGGLLLLLLVGVLSNVPQL